MDERADRAGPPSLQTEWARLLIGSLVGAGVRELVLSPGSRSSLLVHAARMQAGLHVSTLVDERVAAFYALGQARVTGRPTALVRTSGTAAAHDYPAVIEAGMAGLPLIVLTADRPPELWQCGAPQTIDQTRLYGHHARAFFDLGRPSAEPAALRAVRRVAAQAVAWSLHPTPGAVQVNVPQSKPLEPIAGEDAASRRLAAEVDALLATGPTIHHAPPARPGEAAIEALVAAVRGARRGLIVAGPAAAEQGRARDALARLLARSGFLAAVDATSQLRFGGPPSLRALSTALDRAEARSDAPDLILQLGAAPISAAWARFEAEHRGVPRWVVADQGWPDPDGSADHVLSASPAEALEALVARLGRGEAWADADWAARWQARDREAARRIASALAASAAEGSLDEGWVTRRLLERAPSGSALYVANGLPVRHVDVFDPGRTAPLVVWSQRGASGIDGQLAGLAGAAAALGGPAAGLLGDVGFLHDVGGLAALRTVETPLALVVLHNDGGRIFELLPIAGIGLSGDRLADWTTPHGLDLGGFARAFGLAHAEVTEASGFDAALESAWARRGVTVIEARVPPSGAAALARRIREADGSERGAPGETA